MCWKQLTVGTLDALHDGTPQSLAHASTLCLATTTLMEVVTHAVVFAEHNLPQSIAFRKDGLAGVAGKGRHLMAEHGGPVRGRSDEGHHLEEDGVGEFPEKKARLWCANVGYAIHLFCRAW
jgi:hypothetical protein